MKGFVIAGTGSGVGKTSITTGLMSRLSKEYNVPGYKVGPDFIDPMYHTAATGRSSRNLDSFMISKRKIQNLVGNTSKDADICVVEGVRGLFEGISGVTDECSTAEMSKILDLPVILVVNARSLTRSAAAIVNGFCSFDRDVKIAGVIMNNVSGASHENKIRDAMSRYSDVEILGIVRRDTSRSADERNLGLKTPDSLQEIDLMKELTADIDIEMILDAAGTMNQFDQSTPFKERRGQNVSVAVPMDNAFCFYYQENIDCMKASGADVTYFKPTEGDSLPDADIYYLGGGYPELHAHRLHKNRDFIEGMKNASDENKIIIAECGGMLALCNNLTVNKRTYEMAGIFNAEARMTEKRHGPSYVIATATSENPFISETTVKGHEFHYSEVEVIGKHQFGYDVLRGTGIAGKKDGIIYKNTIGTYMHQHALSADDWFGPILDSV